MESVNILPSIVTSLMAIPPIVLPTVTPAPVSIPTSTVPQTVPQAVHQMVPQSVPQTVPQTASPTMACPVTVPPITARSTTVSPITVFDPAPASTSTVHLQSPKRFAQRFHQRLHLQLLLLALISSLRLAAKPLKTFGFGFNKWMISLKRHASPTKEIPVHHSQPRTLWIPLTAFAGLFFIPTDNNTGTPHGNVLKKK